jgi:hypothetical protein
VEDGIRMDLRESGLGGCGLDSTGSGQGPVAGCCECGDEPSGSCATELVFLGVSVYILVSLMGFLSVHITAACPSHCNRHMVIK